MCHWFMDFRLWRSSIPYPICDLANMARVQDNADWISVAAPPPAYTIVSLSFHDGSVRYGVWNGKFWWGYDERVKRACELHPLRWRIPDEKAHLLTDYQEADPPRSTSGAHH
jgi:hypothetical protein